MIPSLEFHDKFNKKSVNEKELFADYESSVALEEVVVKVKMIIKKPSQIMHGGFLSCGY